MRVGFIGLGAQGKRLALNLAHAGHHLVVFDLRREPMEELAAAGAVIAKSPREVGSASEVVEICVVDDAQVENVVLGAGGVLSGAARGTVIAIHSTIRPATVTRIAQAAAACGIEVVDAPVSGGEAGARRKTMSYMVGGSDAAAEKCLPLFTASGRSVTRTGPLGSGMRAKLAHQVIICINILAAHEGMRLGIKAGLSPEVLEKIVHEGGAQSRVADRWFEMSLRPHAIPLFRKDLELGLEFARELGIELPGGALARDLIDEIVP
jgi:3-hydroxyisobutyrate dehydrogenase-like beta-hydroxyacid dehydrogenase